MIILFCIFQIIIVEGIRVRALPKFSKKCLSGSNDREGETTTRTTRKGFFLKTVIYTYGVYLFGAGVAWASGICPFIYLSSKEKLN